MQQYQQTYEQVLDQAVIVALFKARGPLSSHEVMEFIRQGPFNSIIPAEVPAIKTSLGRMYAEKRLIGSPPALVCYSESGWFLRLAADVQIQEALAQNSRNEKIFKLMEAIKTSSDSGLDRFLTLIIPPK